MSAVADSMVASSSRRVALRARRDLSAQRHRYQGRAWWVIKDPLALTYYRFQEEEYAILQMLDGQISLSEIKERFERRFPPQKISLDELHQLVGMFYKSGLAISDAPGQGDELKERHDKRRRKEMWSELANPLSFRLRGFDPDRLLVRIYPYVAWCFTPLAVGLSVVMGLVALLLVLMRFESFQARLPSFEQFFTAENAVTLALAMCVTKILHEFGHALTCKHFGGECHEMGIMLLVFTPALYCNVSDSTMLPNKWRRAAIGAAGMYVELVLASIATFLWWFSQPGLLHHLCLSTMFVCSVSTLMFNANPLLRYDGYYILSDLSEIPNLRQRASEVVQRKLGQWLLGIPPRPEPFLPRRRRWMFACYTVASAVYRWFVTFSICWFLYQFFKAERLQVIGQGFAALSLFALVVQPMWRLGKFFRVPGQTEQVNRMRTICSLAGAAALLLAVVFVPLPHHIMCSVEIQPRDAAAVYVDVPGELKAVHVKPGEMVRQGQLLAELANVEVEFEVSRLKQERDQLQVQVNNAQRQKFRDSSASGRIQELEESLASVQDQLAQKLRDAERLALLAPCDGMVLPPTEVPARREGENRLGKWSGTPLEPRNLGCLLTQSVLFCQIGEPGKLQANLVIDQADVAFVREGQDIGIKLDQLPHDTLPSQVAEVARRDLKITPRGLSNKTGGELATKTDEYGHERPQSVSYEAHAPLDDEAGLLRIGLRGRAKVHTSWQTLGSRAWRYLSQTFHFKM
ncbi:MAG: biotin/lipoyl-binding protein [Pirellulales bacterium]